ncbi:MAG: hypothetical protein MK086_10940 [Flavobacteriales bacterium]|nr:hypothetical protein [Flavobacteriales bacterium]
MTMYEFTDKYKDEASCKAVWKAYRDDQAVVCKKCKGHEHYWKSNKEQYKCKSSGFRTTSRSGTVMQGSKLSYLDWFRAIHLMTSMKKDRSAKEMQRQLGKKRYEPVWAMMHKIRAVMELREDEYQLSGAVEINEDLCIGDGREQRDSR